MKVRKRRPYIVLVGFFAQAVLAVEVIRMLGEPAQGILMTAYVVIVLTLYPFFICTLKGMKFPGDGS